MADREDRVVAALNFLTGEGIGYHPDGCDQETLALINDILARLRQTKNPDPRIVKVWLQFWFILNHKTPLWLVDETVRGKESNTPINDCLIDTGNPWIQHLV